MTDRYDFDVFGNLLSHLGSSTNRRLFNGETFDPAGLYHLRARQYNPAIGRFTAIDPVNGDATAPATLNKYVYANNDPFRYGDPTGKFLGLALGFFLIEALMTLVTASRGVVNLNRFGQAVASGSAVPSAGVAGIGLSGGGNGGSSIGFAGSLEMLAIWSPRPQISVFWSRVWSIGFDAIGNISSGIFAFGGLVPWVRPTFSPSAFAGPVWNVSVPSNHGEWFNTTSFTRGVTTLSASVSCSDRWPVEPVPSNYPYSLTVGIGRSSGNIPAIGMSYSATWYE